MLQYADSGYLIERNPKGDTTTENLQRRELIQSSSIKGISRYLHPLLFKANTPLIITEGSYDKIFLDKALQLLEKSNNIIVECLRSLSEDKDKGGINTIKKYLKENKNVIKCRSQDSPVTVLLDWDSAGKTGNFDLFEDDDPFKIAVWPVNLCNPLLDRSFKGIERFYPTHIIQEAIELGASIGTKQDGTYMVSKEDYSEIKKLLSDLVKDHLEPRDLQNLSDFIITKLLHIS
jgi:hypothetical protein